jgi:glycerol-3-phosphate acyltransferase PlsY
LTDQILELFHHGGVFIVGFLLGSIPFGYLLVLIFRGQDVRKTGSGNIGATNVARTGSKSLAIATLFLDALKGYIAVWIAFRLNGAYFHVLPPPTGTLLDTSSVLWSMQIAYIAASLAGLGALLGHMFTPWLKFKGGKGVATGLGSFLAICPSAVLLCFVIFVVAVVATRYVSLGSILGAVIFPVAAYWLNPVMRDPVIIFLVAISSLLIIVKHQANIRRLVAGNENRLW